VKRALLAMLLFAATARADVVMGWSAASGTILVAHDGRIEAFDRTGERRWSAKGVANPSSIAMTSDGKGAAVLDGYNDRVAIVSLDAGLARIHDTPTTPVAAAFFGHDLWVVLRDTSRVQRITESGEQTNVEVALDPAFVAVSDQFVYVYSRADGVIQEIDPKTAQVTRTVQSGIAGSDLEIRLPKPGEPPGATAYLCLPDGKLAVFNLLVMKGYEVRAGVAPIDLAFVPFGAGLTLTYDTAVIADPGKPAVYASTQIGPSIPIRPPTPVDRIAIARAGVFAFDSGSGVLYRLEGRALTEVLSGLTPTSFVVTDDGVLTWDAKAGKPRR
jgi:DNA-binding beta-propeller fold protein YncE